MNKDSVELHLERLEEWIRKPVRSQNRSRITGLGVAVKSISADTFDDTDDIDVIVAKTNTIIAACPAIKDHIVAELCLPHWLSQGKAVAKSQLVAIEKSLDTYKRLAGMTLPVALRDQLLLEAVVAPSGVLDVETIARQLVMIVQHGICISEETSVMSVKLDLAACSTALLTLQSQFPEQGADVLPQLHGVDLPKALELLEATVAASGQRQEALREQWHGLRKALCLIGCDIEESQPPRTDTGLQEQIESFRAQCLEKIGTEGMALLGFLQGDEDFPKHLSLSDVETALRSLRPLILMAMASGGTDDA